MRPEAARRVGRAPHGGSDDPERIDFSANINPVVPAGVRDVYRDAFEPARSYPPEPPSSFREVAAAYVGCEPTQVVPTPGGLAAIRLAVSLYVSPGETALVPAPSFGEYAREVRLQGGIPRFVPEADVLAADPGDHALAIVCNPNNPTGRVHDAEDLLEFAARCRDEETVLLVDEAFLGFTDRPSLAGAEGVVVARSLTKLFGLPGIRAGFAVAAGPLGEAVRNARRPWNVGLPALATGEYCMAKDRFVAETRARVRSERRRLREALDDKFAITPSEAPFLLCDVGDRDVDRVLEVARDGGVILRDARTFRGLDAHVRVAVRTRAENDQLLEAIGRV